MAEGTVRVEGLTQLMDIVSQSEADLDVFMRDGLLAIADRVSVDVRSRYQPYSEIGAAGVKAKVSTKGAALVVQTLRRGRNMNLRRPNFGPLMMRKAFLPALKHGEAAAAAEFEALRLSLEERWA